MEYAEIRPSLIDLAFKDKSGRVLAYAIKDNYPNLPTELEEFNWYIADAGHCIMAVPLMFYAKARENNEALYYYEAPLPVKYVLEKGYKIVDINNNKHLVVDVPYTKELGVLTGSEYYEFNNISFPQVLS